MAAWIPVAAGIGAMVAVSLPWWTATVRLTMGDADAGGSAELGVIRGASVPAGRAAGLLLLVALLCGLAALGGTGLRLRRTAGLIALAAALLGLLSVGAAAVTGPAFVRGRLDRSVAAQDLARSETAQAFATELAEDSASGTAALTFDAEPRAGIPLTAALALFSGAGAWLVWYGSAKDQPSP